MKRFLDKIAESKWVAFASSLSAILVLGGWIWATVELKGISQPLIIHFNDYIGITKTGGLLDLIWLGLFGIAAVSLNFLMALEFEEVDWFWGKFLAVLNLFIATLIFVSFVVIINVN